MIPTQHVIDGVASGHGGPTLQRFIEKQTRRITNLKTQRLLDLVARFDTEWESDIRAFVVDEKKAALDSVVELRNTIAHGQSVGVTFVRIKDYYDQVKLVVDYVENVFAPPSDSSMSHVE